MKYIDLLQKLQRENQGHVVLMKNGIFFIAIGKDALELNKLIPENRGEAKATK